MRKKVSVLLLSAMIIYTMCGYSSNAKIVQNIEAKKEQVENLRVRDLHGLRAVDTYETEVEEATASDAALSIEINDCLLLEEPYYPTEVIIAAEDNNYELPVAVADSVKGLAKLAGVNEKTICSSISHLKSGRNKTSIYRRVEVEDEEED